MKEVYNYLFKMTEMYCPCFVVSRFKLTKKVKTRSDMVISTVLRRNTVKFEFSGVVLRRSQNTKDPPYSMTCKSVAGLSAVRPK